MTARERIILKASKSSASNNHAQKKKPNTCTCWGCKDPVAIDGMCWYHYKEEHYASK